MIEEINDQQQNIKIGFLNMNFNGLVRHLTFSDKLIFSEYTLSHIREFEINFDQSAVFICLISRIFKANKKFICNLEYLKLFEIKYSESWIELVRLIFEYRQSPLKTTIYVSD